MVATESTAVDSAMLLRFELDKLHVEINGLAREKQAWDSISNKEFGVGIAAAGVLNYMMAFVGFDNRLFAPGVVMGIFYAFGSISEGRSKRAAAMLEEKKELVTTYRRYLPQK